MAFVGEIIDVNGNPYKIVGVYESPNTRAIRWSENGEMVMPRSVISMMFGNREIENLSINRWMIRNEFRKSDSRRRML